MDLGALPPPWLVTAKNSGPSVVDIVLLGVGTMRHILRGRRQILVARTWEREQRWRRRTVAMVQVDAVSGVRVVGYVQRDVFGGE